MKFSLVTVYCAASLFFIGCVRDIKITATQPDPIAIKKLKSTIEESLTENDYFTYIAKQKELAQIYKKADSLGEWLYCYDRIIKISRDKISIDTAIFYYKVVSDNIWRKPNDSTSINNLAWINRQIAYEFGPHFQKWEKCIPYYQEGIDLIEAENSWTPDKAIKFLKPCGSAYTRLGEPQKAISYLIRCYEICSLHNDTLNMLKSLNDLGLAYYDIKNYASAYKYFQIALELNQRNKYIEEKCGTISKLVTLFLDDNHLDSAFHYLNLLQAIIEFDNLENDDIADYYNKRARFSALHNDKINAEKYYNLSIKLFLESGESRKREAAKVYIEIGNLYSATGQYLQSLNAYHQTLKLVINNYTELDVSKPLTEKDYFPENLIIEACTGKADVYYLKYKAYLQAADRENAIVFYNCALYASAHITESFELESSKINFKEKTSLIEAKLNALK